MPRKLAPGSGLAICARFPGSPGASRRDTTPRRVVGIPMRPLAMFKASAMDESVALSATGAALAILTCKGVYYFEQ